MIKTRWLVLSSVITLSLGYLIGKDFHLDRYPAFRSASIESSTPSSDFKPTPGEAGQAASSLRPSTPKQDDPQISKVANLAKEKIAQNEKKIEAIDSQINQLNTTPSDSNTTDVTLQEKIDQQKNTLAALDAQIENHQAATASKQKELALSASQNSQVRQNALADLQLQIQSQISIVNQRWNLMRNTFAIDDSDIMVQRKKDLQVEQEKLAALQNQYYSILHSEETDTRLRVNAEKQIIQEQQAGQAELKAARAMAQAELQKLVQQKESNTEDPHERQAQLEKLNKERQNLMDENERLIQAVT